MNISTQFSLILKGMAMGIAEVIPGVSGGTIAFITGIYEELISTINSVNIDLLKLIKQFEIKKAWHHVNGGFLLKLIGGMVLGIVVSVFSVSHLLVHYPEILWAFFFGLILSSVWVVFKMMKQPGWSLLIQFLLGVAFAYWIVTLDPRPANDSYLFIFLSGMVAICALILPGISGSFILLLLGMYTLIIPTLKGFLSSPEWSEFKIVAVFAMGCLIGILSFSRLLSWTFKNYYDPTLAVLCGFMIGSLPKIWPWRNPVTYINKDTGQLMSAEKMKTVRLEADQFEILTEVNVFPSSYFQDPNTLLVIIALILGFGSVLMLKSKSTKS